MRYRWRLDGEGWSNWTDRTDVTYTAMSSGSYQFEVQTMNRGGRVDRTPADQPYADRGKSGDKGTVVQHRFTRTAHTLISTSRIPRYYPVMRKTPLAAEILDRVYQAGYR